MAELKADVLVLGAGMVGVGAALHLQQRGRDWSWSTGTSLPAKRPVMATADDRMRVGLSLYVSPGFADP